MSKDQMATESEKRQAMAAASISDRKEEILRAWIELTCEKIAGARELSEPALIDDVPQILDLLCAVLEHRNTSPAVAYEPVRDHGVQRAKLTRTTITWVLEEMRLLREVVLRHTRPMLERSDLLLIFEVFEEVVDVTVAAFAEQEVEAVREEITASQVSLAALRETKRLLEEERDQREMFVSAIVHDLRTPLSSLQFATDLVADFPDEPEMRELALDKLRRNIALLSAMAQRLLDVNHITAGRRLPLHVERFDITRVVHDTAGDMRDHCPNDFREQASASCLVLDLPDVEVVGWSSVEAISRITSNLVDNALKYGEPPVTVGLEAADEDLWLRVHNHGTPIPPERHTSIFDRFERLDGDTGAGRRGWGLGLTLVRGLADALGGHVELESTEADGTTFSVRLPRDSRPHQERG